MPRRNLTPAVLLLCLFSARLLQAEGSLLDQSAQVNLANKTYETLIEEICRGCGVPVEIQPIVSDDGPDPALLRQTGGASSREQAGMAFKFVTLGGERLYTIQTTRAQPLRDLLKYLCLNEGLEPVVQDGRLKIVPLYTLPFSGELKQIFTDYTYTADPDWRKLIKEILMARAQPEEWPRRLSSTEQQAGPRTLSRPLNAIKGYPESDAIRAWLLSEAAIRIGEWGVGSDRSRAAYIIAAARSARQILLSGDGDKNLGELAQVLRPLCDKTQTAYSDRQLLQHQLACGAMAAAHACGELRQRAAALEWSRNAAYELLPFGDDSFFDEFHAVAADCRGTLGRTSDPQMLTKNDRSLEVAEADLTHLKNTKVTPELLARAHYRLARAYNRNKQAEQAAAQLRLALAADPIHGGAPRPATRLSGRDPRPTPVLSLAGVILDLSKTLESAGQRTASIALLEEYERKLPAEIDLLAELARLLRVAERTPEAIARYKQLLELKPDSDDYLNHLAVLEGRAIKTGEHVLPIAPEVLDRKNKIEALQLKVAQLKAQKKLDEALQAVRAQAKDYPNNSELMLIEIHLLMTMSRFAEAEKRLDEHDKIMVKEPWRAPTAHLRQVIRDMKAMGATPNAVKPPAKPEDF